MKLNKIFFAAIAAGICSLGLSAQENDPVLMRVAGTEVKRSEFEYAFNKNRVSDENMEEQIQEYLPLYVNFKLKIAEAKAQRLDTLSSFKEEYLKDRSALAEEYLTDKSYIEQEARKIYEKDSATIGKDGFLKVTQLAVRVPQNSTPEQIAAAKSKIDSAYVMLQSGSSFEEAGKYLGMATSATRPFEVLRGQAYEEFEKAVFVLADGEYTAPFKTPAAYHIVKRESSRPFGSYESYREAIINMLEKQNIQQAARIKRGTDLAKEMGGGLTPEQALAREDSLLESKYPEFGNLMREYYEGLLFFEISNREVWKSDEDLAAAQAKFFKKNKKKYKFDAPHFRGAVLYAKTQEVLDKAKQLLQDKSKEEYRDIVAQHFLNDSVRLVRLELGVYAIGDNGWVDKFAFGQGEGGAERKNLPFVDVVGKVIEAPETFEDVKGDVANDYNKYKEEKWLKKLRKKYSVEIDKEVLKTVNKHD